MNPLMIGGEERGLLRAICSEPEDDTPRLVYADWLEESGIERNVMRSEFIRVQLEMAETPFAYQVRHWPWNDKSGGKSVVIPLAWRRAMELHDREMRLLWSHPNGSPVANWVAWSLHDGIGEDGWPCDKFGRGSCVTPAGTPGLGGRQPAFALCVSTSDGEDRQWVWQTFNRGFVALASSTLDAVLKLQSKYHDLSPTQYITVSGGYHFTDARQVVSPDYSETR